MTVRTAGRAARSIGLRRLPGADERRAVLHRDDPDGGTAAILRGSTAAVSAAGRR